MDIRERFFANIIFTAMLYLVAGALWFADGAAAQDIPCADEDVLALRVSGDTLYVGGTFRFLGAPSGTFGVVAEDSGESADSFPEFNDTINRIISDGDGGWYVAGEFTKAGGLVQPFLARVN